MKIALDAQLLLEEKKTGIGRTAKEIIDHMIQIPGNQYQLNYFYCRYSRKKQKQILKFYKEQGCILKGHSWLLGAIYRRVTKIIPIPYWWLFGKDSDITQFFNYEVPFGVRGKKSTIVHDMCYKAYPETVELKTRQWLERELEISCERADVIITDSNFSKIEIQKYLNVVQEKIKVVYCGVDHHTYHQNLEEEKLQFVKEKYGIQKPYLLYLGTLEPRKNILLILEVFQEVSKKNQEISLIIAGKKGWMYESIFEKVKEYGISDRVIFTDYVLEEEVPYLYYGAEIFLFPSIYEGFGLPILEAMACGTPVIVSNQASLPEVGGKAVLYINIKDESAVEQMDEAIEKLLNNMMFYNEKKKLSEEQAKKFTWNKAAQKFIKTYQTLLVEDKK